VIPQPAEHGPSRAERARTVVENATTLAIEAGNRIEVVDVRAVDTDGSLVLLASAEGALSGSAATGPASCSVHGALLSPLVGSDRMLDSVVLRGQVDLVDADDLGTAIAVLASAYPGRSAEVVLLHEGTVLLRLTAVQVRLNGEVVEPEAYRDAEGDPLAAGSDEIVTHLVQEHAPEVVMLAHLLDPELIRVARMLAPIRVDRFGLTFRITTGTSTTDARLDFVAALRGPAELPAALQALQRRAAQVTRCPYSGEPRNA
jgi:hypothetical protein